MPQPAHYEPQHPENTEGQKQFRFLAFANCARRFLGEMIAPCWIPRESVADARAGRKRLNP